MSLAHHTIATLAALAFGSAGALADDLSPPTWRGDAGTTFQHWGFDVAGGGLPDNGLNNPYGAPIFTPNGGASWDPTDPSGQRMGTYVINQNQTLDFEIPNHGLAGGQKEVWLQYVYTTIDGFGPMSSVLDPAAGINFTLVNSVSTDLGGGLYHQLDVFTYNDCPGSEIVTLAPGTFNSPAWIDQVVVDTRCVMVPAPATAGLVGAGGLLAVRRRRLA